MTSRVRRDGGLARKRLDHATGEPAAAELVRRSRRLAAYGVPTPQARYDISSGEIVFPWLAGISGRDALRRQRGTIDRLGERQLGACLRTLVRLHDVVPAGLSLQPLDPWRRIDCRLRELRREPTAEEARAIYRGAWRVRQSAEQRLCSLLAEPGSANPVLIHGDFHVGQLLFAGGANEPWLLDLDDLALAPRESDIANFAAHLATIESRPEGCQETFCVLITRLREGYEIMARRALDPRLVSVYGAIALLRRALKRREGETSAAFVIDILSTAEWAAQGYGRGQCGATPVSPTGARPAQERYLIADEPMGSPKIPTT